MKLMRLSRITKSIMQSIMYKNNMGILGVSCLREAPFLRRNFRESQSFPWRNSLSQKMAILYYVSTISREPGRTLYFLR